ncbi:MAG TPA: DUF4350 domain-containing protein [Pyrinomonadaceae bacterium]
MRQKFYIFGGLFFLAITLVGLNAASYVQREKEPDSELFPNRSTYNAGATGTRAFYELLSETGRKTMRWQEPPNVLLSNKNAPQTFVIIGTVKREFTDSEAKDLLQWVSEGGKLVIIDRDPPRDLQTTTANWSLSLSGEPAPELFGIDPSDARQMTEKVSAVPPAQPTVYTKNVIAVQPSRFSSSVIFERFSNGEKNLTKTPESIGIGPVPPPPPPPARISPTPYQEEFFNEEQLKATPTPRYQKPPTVFQESSANKDSQPVWNDEATKNIPANPPVEIQASDNPISEIETPVPGAPFVHLANRDKNILVDVPFGSGQIVYLADPFIVSNAGISLVDNAQTGINILASRGGTIAFDEYHQGYGTNNNRLFQYFAGTPVVAIFLQIALLAGLILFSQSRRFARPLPENEPNRLSKLEYISAMAELQRRTKAYDLAIENIYTDFRRRAAKLFGTDVHGISRTEFAKMIAGRAKLNESETAELLRKCEDIMHGEPTNKKEVLQIASRLREIEEKLGLKRARRQNGA